MYNRAFVRFPHTVVLIFQFLFFFFQAEDGIRDYKVTGVQTCALPISPPCTYRARRSRGRRPRRRRGGAGCSSWSPPPQASAGESAAARAASAVRARSGERRVGEEGRSRWAPDH